MKFTTIDFTELYKKSNLHHLSVSSVIQTSQQGGKKKSQKENEEEDEFNPDERSYIPGEREKADNDMGIPQGREQEHHHQPSF